MVDEKIERPNYMSFGYIFHKNI